MPMESPKHDQNDKKEDGFIQRLQKNDSNHPRIAFTHYEVDDKRSSIISSLLLLFAIMETVVSFVFPIVDAFSPSRHNQHKFYLEIFKIIQSVVSVVALAYLQALMSYYERQTDDCEIELKTIKAPKGDGTSSTQIKYESTDIKREESNIDFIEADSSVRSSQSSAPTISYDCHHVEKTNFGKEIEINVDKKNYCTRRTGETADVGYHSRRESASNGSVSREIEMEPSQITVKRRILTIGKIFGDHIRLDRKMNPPITENVQGNNLYLRLGAVVFGFGVMIMDGLRVADQFDLSNSALACHSVLWIPVNVIHSVYVFWQTYFLFKYHRVVFNIQKLFIRFILCHMTVVNLGQWLSTVVQEIMISDDSNESIPILPSFMNSNTTTNSTLSATCKSQVSTFAHYLIPCGVEYSLIACAIFYKLLRRVGHVPKVNTVNCQGLTNLKLRPEGECSSGDGPTECQHAHKGLFAGLLLVVSTLFALALFYTYLQRDNFLEALVVFQVTDIVLLSFGILAVGVALYQMRVLCLRQLSEEIAFDDDLLLFGLLGILFFNMFLLVPALEATGQHQVEGCLFVFKAVLEILQALMQVFLILEASRSQAANERQMIEKPGRAIVTFLLILNLAMWIVSTFGLKHAEKYSIQRTHYTDIAWKIITHLSLPLIIFFRFHSTICLADIWTNAYRMHSPSCV